MNHLKLSNKLFYLPIKLVLFYISLSFLISIFGPAEYYGYNKLPVVIFMLAFCFFIYGGYWVGLHLKNNINFSYVNSEIYKNRRERLITKLTEWSLIISCIGVLLFLFSSIRSGSLNFTLANVGDNYINRDSFKGSGYTIEYLYRFFTGIFRYIAMCFPVLYYSKVSKLYRSMFWFYIITYFLINCVGQGSQKSGFDLLLFVGGTWIFNKYKVNAVNIKFRYFVILFIFGCFFMFYLSYNQFLRYSTIGVTALNYGSKSISGMSFNTDHIIFQLFGYDLGFGLASILGGYMSAGYYGLSLCLSLPFKWTYGLGNSLVLSKFVSWYTGYYAYEDTYVARMSAIYGRDGLTSWNTIFPWLASDLTFPGTIIFFFFVGMLFSYTWKEFIVYSNPVSLLLFITLMLGLIFVPSNNQLFTGIDGFISTYCIIFLWYFRHKRYYKLC